MSILLTLLIRKMDDHAGSSRGALGSCSLEDEDPSTLQETSRDSGDEVCVYFCCAPHLFRRK